MGTPGLTACLRGIRLQDIIHLAACDPFSTSHEKKLTYVRECTKDIQRLWYKGDITVLVGLCMRLYAVAAVPRPVEMRRSPVSKSTSVHRRAVSSPTRSPVRNWKRAAR